MKAHESKEGKVRKAIVHMTIDFVINRNKSPSDLSQDYDK
jgi:hypothetical protein